MTKKAGRELRIIPYDYASAYVILHQKRAFILSLTSAFNFTFNLFICQGQRATDGRGSLQSLDELFSGFRSHDVGTMHWQNKRPIVMEFPPYCSIAAEKPCLLSKAKLSFEKAIFCPNIRLHKRCKPPFVISSF